ncbi:MAG: UDP-N-acetylmuramoyl-L-alanine--D-glutamate ligase, partial [Bacteroidota bacterium]
STAEKLQASFVDLKAAGIAYEAGKHSERVYDCALMVVSPGVPSNAPVVLEAQKRGKKIVSELEVGSWFCCAPIVAITGSNGKTTTTTLTGELLKNAKKGHVIAGNIGTAFSSLVSALTETDVAVLEVSSFQLDHIATFRPRISALLNITPDHMDRYDHSMEKYAASKARIFENQAGDDVAMYNADDEWTKKVIGKARCRKIGFSVKTTLPEGAFLEEGMLVTRLNGERAEIVPVENIFIKGTHNVYNAMASVLIGQMLGVDAQSIRSTLKTFKGVEHRLEFVRELNNIRYYNDSKATNVDSVWYALQAFKKPIVLILGGRDKGNDYSRLTELAKEHVRAIVAIGESSDTVEKAFRGTVVVKKAASMEEAVSTAKFLAEPGNIVLLSPACASFDWFRNYEHRGEVFKELVNTL